MFPGKTGHALLAHLADRGFARSPRPLGVDGQGREGHGRLRLFLVDDLETALGELEHFP